MFDIASSRIAWIPVKWRSLRSIDDKPAEYVEHEIELKADLIDRDAFRKLGEAPAEGENPKSEIEQFRELVKDWRGVVSKGAPVPFVDANIDKLLKQPGFAEGFNTAYTEAWVGVLELRAKNSDGSGENGQAAPEQAQ